MVNNSDIKNMLSIVLSFGHEYKFYSKVVEKRVGKSAYFIAAENNNDDLILYSSSNKVLSTIFYDVDISKYSNSLYNGCVWLSDLYVQIQMKTNMTFEAIFLYLPIEDGFYMYPLYHEMDFNQGIDFFLERVNKHSVLWHAMKRRDVSIDELAKASGLSYQTISSFRTRKNDIGKASARSLLKIASYLCIRPETLLCDINPRTFK